MDSDREEDVAIDVTSLSPKPSNAYIIRRYSDSSIDLNELLLLSGKKKTEGDEETKSLGDEGAISPFKYNHDGLTSEQAAELLAIHGRNEIPEKKIPSWYIFLSQLWQPMPLMIWIAAIIEAGIQNWIDMAILLFILFANAFIAFYEITKAGDAVAALKKSLQARATVKRDGQWSTIEAALIVPEDLILLASGSAIPADCRVNDGEIDVDQAALTGESLPVQMFKGSSCKMGSTVVRGEVEATVEFTGSNTFFGKTASLLVQTDELSNLQMVLIRIILVLVVISITLCVIVLVYVTILSNISEALSFAVVLLVASIPLAIEIVTTTTLALGSHKLAEEGAIVARLAAIEDMAGMSILCSDKTGTLTLNKMEIQEQTPVYKAGIDQYQLLRYAAMAAKWKEPPRDALDTLVLTRVDLASLKNVIQTNFVPFDPVIKRTEGTVIENGKTFKTTKGAPHVLLKLLKDPPSEEVSKIIDDCERDVHELGLRGIRALAVAKTNEEDEWEMLGLLTFLDPPRPDTKQTIDDARHYGIDLKMITGDHILIAKETARVLGLGYDIKSAEGLPLLDPVTKKKPDNLGRDYGDMCLAANGFAQVFPEHKYLIVECLRELGYKVGMTGDGVNDAPALKRADVGVAVDGATDAARAAADIILTRPGLSTIVQGIKISRCIFVRISNFFVYRISATLQLLLFFFISVFAFKPIDYMPSDWRTRSDFPDHRSWPSFFHMPVLMLMLITLLNDGTLIAIGYDNSIPRETPERWNLPILFLVSLVLALVALVSSLILLYILLESWSSAASNTNTNIHNPELAKFWGSNGLSYGQITTSIYLKVSVSDFLTLFSARSGPHPFWKSQPSFILLCAAVVALSSSTILACSWPPSYPDDIYALGLGRRKPYAMAVYIWIYCLLWWIVQDACKVLLYMTIVRFNIFGFNDSTAEHISKCRERSKHLSKPPTSLPSSPPPETKHANNRAL